MVLMKMVRELAELESARKLMYGRLADFMLQNIDISRVSTVLEAGCGRGSLTVHLAERIGERCKIIAFDIFEGPYRGDLENLRKTVQKMGLENIIKIVKGDVRNMKGINNETVDLILSNELFCDLDRQGLQRALQEFYRILKPKRQMVHGELIPAAENRAQELVIEANSYSLETMVPRPEWFSPTADEVVALMHKMGFTEFLVKYFKTNLRLGFDVALNVLKEWNTDPDFIVRHEKELRRYGLEFPMEHVIFSEKG